MTINHCCICDDNQEDLKNLQLELITLRSLVREMAEVLRKVAWRSKIHLSECDCADCEAVDRVLDRPEVKKIMEGK
jgi:hypothetical protein